MSFYLVLILAAVTLSLLGRSWKQRWLAWQKGQTKLTKTAQAAASTVPSPAKVRTRVTQEWGALRDRFSFGAKQAALAQRFRAWATEALAADEDLRAWLNALPPDAIIAFTQQVAEFCAEMGFELAALVDGQLDQVPTTAHKAQAIVLHYCRANWQAAGAQTDFEAFKQFLSYLRAPAQKANQQFGQNLYTKLVQKQIALPPSFDMMLASDAQRRTHTLAAIQQAATQDPQLFNSALKELIAESENTQPLDTMQAISAVITV